MGGKRESVDNNFTRPRWRKARQKEKVEVDFHETFSLRSDLITVKLYAEYIQKKKLDCNEGGMQEATLPMLSEKSPLDKFWKPFGKIKKVKK